MHRPIGAALALVVALGLAGLAMPRATAACSCVMPEDIVDTAGQEPGSAVFTATAGPRVGNDIPVIVTRWLAGLPPAGAVVIQGTDPNDMCGPTSPPPGGEYLFVTYHSETSRFNINGCSVQADLATPAGQALLARAMGRFGPGTVVGPDPSPSPASGGEPREGDLAAQLVGLLPFVIAALFSVGLVYGLVGVLKQSRSSDG